MTQPTNRSANGRIKLPSPARLPSPSASILRLQDAVAESWFEQSLSEAISLRQCVCCSEHVDTEAFRDIESRREYRISGMCQKCQNAAFS